MVLSKPAAEENLGTEDPMSTVDRTTRGNTREKEYFVDEACLLMVSPRGCNLFIKKLSTDIHTKRLSCQLNTSL